MRNIVTAMILLISSGLLSGNDGYRRNGSVDIINYRFTISVSDSSDVIYGNSQIRINFKAFREPLKIDLKSVRSDGKGMMVDSVSFSEGRVEWSHKEDKITIIPDGQSAKLTTGILEIAYHGIPADGLIISKNKFGSRTFFSDHWPDRASNYLPCIDHPYDKATVDFIIIAPEHYEVIASGDLTEERHIYGNMKLSHWKEEVPLATKVMAFAAAEFDIQLAGKPEAIPVWSYVFRENSKAGFYDYSVAVKPLTFFSHLIGPYPFSRLSNVQSKTIFGGLENAGCIFYSERSVTGKGNIEGLIAHEIAHQWFGNSVTENDWHHVWLSEGFATYLTSVYDEMTTGRESFEESMRKAREVVIKYYLRSPRPVIDTTVTDYMELLNANSYQKGAWVLHMLRNEIGEGPFWEGLRFFFERYRNGNAVTDDFIGIMEEVSEKELDGFFRQWLYLPGIPELKVKNRRTGKGGVSEIIIDQKQKELFSFPLELLIVSQTGELSKTVVVTERTTKLVVQIEKVTAVIPDPRMRLLYRLVE